MRSTHYCYRIVLALCAGVTLLGCQRGAPASAESALLEGRLVDAQSGAPMAGTQVLLARIIAADSAGHTLDMSFDLRLSPDSQRSRFGFANLLSTDPQGRFRFTGVPSGSYGLVGFLPSARMEIIDAKSGRPVDIRMDSLGRPVDLGTIRVRAAPNSLTKLP